MRLAIDTRMSVEENAAKYFEKAKKAKKKLEGAKKALASTYERIGKQEEKQERQERRKKKEWYEKFRWFISSEGFLCIGGNDATTNEVVVKKHAEPNDLVFHTDMSGAPFIVVKSEGKEIPQTTRQEAAQFCACYSRAWKKGYATIEVFSAKPDQLSKTPEQGEYLQKGAFVVRGHVDYYKPEISLVIGRLQDGRAMAAPSTAILKNCGSGYEVLQGNEKSSDVSKRLAKLLESHPDEINPLLPSGVKMGRKVS